MSIPACKCPKIRVRKLRQYWYVFISGDLPDFPRFQHFSDAVAKVQFEFREAYHMKELEMAIIEAMEELDIIDTRRFGEVVFRHVLPVFQKATDLTFEAGKVLERYQDSRRSANAGVGVPAAATERKT